LMELFALNVHKEPIRAYRGRSAKTTAQLVQGE